MNTGYQPKNLQSCTDPLFSTFWSFCLWPSLSKNREGERIFDECDFCSIRPSSVGISTCPVTTTGSRELRGSRGIKRVRGRPITWHSFGVVIIGCLPVDRPLSIEQDSSGSFNQFTASNQHVYIYIYLYTYIVICTTFLRACLSPPFWNSRLPTTGNGQQRLRAPLRGVPISTSRKPWKRKRRWGYTLVN